jgi:hypothetical protein
MVSFFTLKECGMFCFGVAVFDSQVDRLDVEKFSVETLPK